ncbi:MAG TPA: hypothetical protein VIK75_05675 [Calditerricola sp.]
MDDRLIPWHHKDDSAPPAAREPQKGPFLRSPQMAIAQPVDRAFLADRDAGLMDDPHLLGYVPFEEDGTRTTQD